MPNENRLATWEKTIKYNGLNRFLLVIIAVLCNFGVYHIISHVWTPTLKPHELYSTHAKMRMLATETRALKKEHLVGGAITILKNDGVRQLG
jgi:hypothetical protein